MERVVALALALCAVSGASFAAQQVYIWVDEKGNKEYRDTPPPPGATKVEKRTIGISTIETSELPYSVQQAVRNFPVTLWTTNCGGPCDQARALLTRRGVPHTEKDPQADIEAFAKLTGSTEIPVLYVGNNRLRGFLESEWEAALDAAGYPKTAITIGGKPLAKRSPAPRTPSGATPPVRLYTHAECGAPCADAKSLLVDRGVRFQEIPIEEQAAIDELHKLTGDTRVPVLVVGQTVVRGFLTAGYHDALDAAGFPRSQQASKP